MKQFGLLYEFGASNDCILRVPPVVVGVMSSNLLVDTPLCLGFGMMVHHLMLMLGTE